MRNPLFKILSSTALLLLLIVPSFAQDTGDCEISDAVVANVRLYLTAEDNVPFFDIFTVDEITCACIDLYRNDPVDAPFHDRVIAGAVVLLGQTGDPRAVPTMIDAIETHPSQALYNLGNFSTVDSLNTLVANIRNLDDESRESAAEGLRQLKVPVEIEDGWVTALENAIAEVGDWMTQEPVPDFQLYFIDAYANLQFLLENATSTSGVE